MEHNPKVVETGISGLDKVLSGGIPEGNQVLLAGAPGMGKTLMGMWVLYNCAKKGIHCAFVTLDQSPETVVSEFKRAFTGVDDVDKLLKEKMLVIGGYDTASKIAANTEFESAYSMGNLVSEIDGIAKSVNARVIVVDSLSFLKLMLGKSILYNKSIASMVANLRRQGTTSILSMNIPYYDAQRMKFGQESLLFDGLIALYKDKGEDLMMQVVKMRGTTHSRSLLHYEITATGITLK